MEIEDGCAVFRKRKPLHALPSTNADVGYSEGYHTRDQLLNLKQFEEAMDWVLHGILETPKAAISEGGS